MIPFPSSVLVGDTIEMMATLPERSAHCCVTSPPYYGLRNYGVDGQIGLEETPEAFVSKMVDVFRGVWRVLRDDGTLWLNLGDSYNSAASGQNGQSGTLMGGLPCGGNGTTAGRRTLYAGLKHKDLMMMPWRVALALQADGWYLRSIIVWAKKSPMPESVTDRPTSSWEPIFLMAKSDRYFYDAEAVKEESAVGSNGSSFTSAYDIATKPGLGQGGRTDTITRNQRNVWHLGPEPYREAHFATFPTEIPRRAIKAGTSEKGCCPACGAPWRRIVSKTPILRDRPNDYTKRTGEDGTGNSCANTVAGVETRTLGWEPTCKCPLHVPVPCVVLDPFLGSGTTVAVARELGRHGVGCELNPEYAALARDRIGRAERPSTYVSERSDDDAPLFAGQGVNDE